MNKYLKFFLFVILLILSNLYLFRPGFWFYQDASYWPKNTQEVVVLISQQLHTFINYGYYLGFDQGLFAFTRILVNLIIAGLFIVFGFTGSQIAFSIFGYVLTFISFYLFSSISFKDKDVRFVLSLVYTFSPLSYAEQGYVFYNAVIPLFLYSLYHFFYGGKGKIFRVLLINVIAGYLLIAYIRFFEAFLLVIIPYIIFIFIQNKSRVSLKRLVLYIISYVLLFLPVVYSFLSQMFEKGQTAFQYGSVFSQFYKGNNFFNAFNFFQSVGVPFYEGIVWSVLGILLSAGFIYYLITFKRQYVNALYLFNLCLFLFGIALFGLGDLFGSTLYKSLILIFPFVINGQFWALYVVFFPFVVLLGIILQYRIRVLFAFSAVFVILATAPLLNVASFSLQKYKLKDIPAPYQEYFINSYLGIPESTYYSVNPCWRARYMNDANVPTACINWGLHYSSMVFGDPRLASGETYALSHILSDSTNLNNLRVTHNLKNVIVPTDIVEKRGPGQLTNFDDIKQVGIITNQLNANKELSVSENGNFNHYSFNNKNLYDFFLYIPKTIITSDSLQSVMNSNIKLKDRPVILSSQRTHDYQAQVGIHLSYKISPLDPTEYYVKLSGVGTDPFILALNQTYSPDWKIVWIDKSAYDKVSCSAYIYFSLTNNSRCQFSNRFFNISDLGLIGKKEVNDQDHLQSNFLNNAWLINPKGLKSVDRNLYAVVIFTKQIYYNVSIIVAVATLGVLIALTLYQELKKS